MGEACDSNAAEATTERLRALVIGAGPAGLMAAERLAARGLAPVIVDAMPSPARKLLMAGKSGLNLTKVEPEAPFRAAFGAAAGPLAPMLDAFGPEAVQDWARGLGVTLFTGSTGRVFPREMKAAPLLRAWLRRLDAAGATLRTRWRWSGWDGAFQFDTPEGPRRIAPEVCVLALGGASWPRLGSDGGWAPLLAARGVTLAPFRPANAGLRVDWAPQMARHFGTPVKGVALTAGALASRGEFVISERGLEGGGIYAVFAQVRDGAPLVADLIPDVTADEATARLAASRGKATWAAHLRKRLGLDPARLALAQEFGRPLPTDPAALAARLKALPITHAGPRPLAEAISSAGGVPFGALDTGLMLRAAPGTFVAGEMLDWEAPTGGYLLTGCFATGAWAGTVAADYVA